MRRAKIIAVAALGLTGLAACGQTMGDQAALGAAAGGVTAAATGGNIVGGAVIGAGANTLYCQTKAGGCRNP